MSSPCGNGIKQNRRNLYMRLAEVLVEKELYLALNIKKKETTSKKKKTA